MLPHPPGSAWRVSRDRRELHPSWVDMYRAGEINTRIYICYNFFFKISVRFIVIGVCAYEKASPEIQCSRNACSNNNNDTLAFHPNKQQMRSWDHDIKTETYHTVGTGSSKVNYSKCQLLVCGDKLTGHGMSTSFKVLIGGAVIQWVNTGPTVACHSKM